MQIADFIKFQGWIDDDYVPKDMCKQMYSVKNGYKEIYIPKNAGHVQAYLNNRDEYEKRVDKFLNSINIISTNAD